MRAELIGRLGLMCIFLLCLICLRVGGVDVENERAERSGCGERASGLDVEKERVDWMWTISEEDARFYLCLQKNSSNTTLICFCFVLMIM